MYNVFANYLVHASYFKGKKVITKIAIVEKHFNTDLLLRHISEFNCEQSKEPDYSCRENI